MTPDRVLVANRDDGFCDRLRCGLADQGFVVDSARTARQCLDLLHSEYYKALLADRELEDLAIEHLLEQARRAQPALVVMVVCAQGDCREALHLARLGLDDYLPAALPPAKLAALLREAIAQRRRRTPASSSDQAGSLLIGRSRPIQEVLELVRLIAPKHSTVLITGPTGVGKEIVARLIHALSPRSSRPMVTVNCGAVPPDLLEAEFFGHVRGAFTGAVEGRVGRFEQAHRSTLFLDEIGEMSFDLQAKVLRAVQEREFQRVGSSQNVRVDLRVVAATNCDLAARVARGQFRQDLYYRLNVVPVYVASLAERLEDLPLLVEHFLEKICRQEDLPLKSAAPPTVKRLLDYHWPGNVRELENAIEKAVVLSGERHELYASDFSLPAVEPAPGAVPDAHLRLPAAGLDLEVLLRHIERSLLDQALERTGGNKKRAADILRLKRTTLSAKLRSLRARG